MTPIDREHLDLIPLIAQELERRFLRVQGRAGSVVQTRLLDPCVSRRVADFAVDIVPGAMVQANSVTHSELTARHAPHGGGLLFDFGLLRDISA
jgi:hypothetical protein